MKKLALLAALATGLSMTANAQDLSDYLDSQYEIQWAQEDRFVEHHSDSILDPLAAYDLEGTLPNTGSTDFSGTPVVDIAVMEIVGKPLSNEDSVLFVETYE